MGESRDTPVEDCARFIYHEFLRYNVDFRRITRRAAGHFVSSDWIGGRVKVEAVLMSEDDMSILFGFTRSYFFVDLDNVVGAVHYLRALMPDKPIDELYTVLGRIRQGKTERYRDLARRLKRTQDVFCHAPGDKELAMTNIFPGDMLLKNFGVTRHGRVIFYDFDEICLMNQCHFRELPTARRDEQELAAETWFYVADNDVFPEQFENFLGMSVGLKALFMEHHGDLLSAAYWREVQEKIETSGALPFSPYARASRAPT